MMVRRVLFAVLLNMAVLALRVPTANADDLCSAGALPLERQLRQLYLDLLARPPTIAEYRAARAKGAIDEADIRGLMERDEFYARMNRYHRALLRANVSASLPQNNVPSSTSRATSRRCQQERHARGGAAGHAGQRDLVRGAREHGAG